MPLFPAKLTLPFVCSLIFFAASGFAQSSDSARLNFPYRTTAAWEKRKDSVRRCMSEILALSSIPPASNASPVFGSTRTYRGYSVRNFYLETTPGLFVCGSLYAPLKQNGRVPAVLVPNGHFLEGRYRADVQYACASLARMGAIALNYDMFGWGESRLQVEERDHYTPAAMIAQMLNTRRLLDYILLRPDVDPLRIGITGTSGGGSQSMLNTALDDRITLSVPIVMLSSTFPGGCACENGIRIRLCNGGVNNAEIAAMAAPRPQLVVSDGNDWTKQVPQIEYPYLQQVYNVYGQPNNMKNVHLANEGHDFGRSKRSAMYAFIAGQFKLDMKVITDNQGRVDESGAYIEDESAMHAFGSKGEALPANALKGINAVCNALSLPASAAVHQEGR